ncbi:MAG: DNA mismatch repair endonuclease MutL, partial [Thermomicrobiales bacterium]
MKVHVLTAETIGKIAAGEVVERPVSVVKELIENAIDAESTDIRIEIETGGTTLIRVSDNGEGMAADDLALALQRHATSKLSTFEDLATIASLGFRGEALPSIAAVSDLEIRSSAIGSAVGSRLSAPFASEPRIEPHASSKGTSVTIRDLFGNVPARRKFLRQPSTEGTYITRLIQAYALHFSWIRWALISDGRSVLTTHGSGDDIDAAVRIVGSELMGEALDLGNASGDAAVPGIDVSGWVSSPRVTRSHRQNLYFFVNGRLVQNRALMFSLEEAFHSLLMIGRHPLGMIRINLDPRDVDVNVHPGKTEVKFVDERLVCRAVSRSVHQSLLLQSQDVMPDVRFSPQRPTDDRIQTLLNTPLPERQEDGRTVDPEDREPMQPHGRHQSGVPVMRVLGQISGTYIIAEGPEGLFLIDQHAAHERVMYEKILGQMAGTGVERQPLLDPLVVELPPEELAVLEKSREELAQIGFDVDMFGGTSALVRAVPAIVSGVNISERLHLILQELAEGGVGDSWLDSVAISAACHTSIRAGQLLT